MSDPQNPTDTMGETAAGDPQATAATAAPSPTVEQLQKERDDIYNRLLRKSAEFDNFRKRIERERKEFTDWAMQLA